MVRSWPEGGRSAKLGQHGLELTERPGRDARDRLVALAGHVRLDRFEPDDEVARLRRRPGEDDG